ncbi:calcium-activated chloride channel regulator 1-like [Glandiceps talaboti]
MSSKTLTILCILTIVTLWSASDVDGRRNPIQLIDNGYETLLIAIHESIPEDPLLIERLEEIFTDASYDLYGATELRTFYREITILIPNTWSRDLADADATTERFDIANVIVDKPNPEYGDNPYTQQIRDCGEEGEFIHLTERWVTDEQYSTQLWGDAGKVIVHEWGHLRWGLFDEYPIDEDEHFYYEINGDVQPTRCAKSIRGQSRDVTDGYKSCNTNPSSGVMPGPGCVFFPDKENNIGTGSYMYANYVDSVRTFCHSSSAGDPLAKHNRLATNKQNKRCSYQSAWDVMLQHDDFADEANPPGGEQNTRPTFQVVREVDIRVVLVLDVSGSMTRNNRFEHLIQASTIYIAYTVPDNSWVGIVEFASKADTSILSDLVQVNTLESRQNLIAKLPEKPLSGTCIGCGLETGVDVLEKGGKSAAGGILFLVSDGEENEKPSIEDVIDDLSDGGIIVDTMAQSDEADQGLAELSDQTGGRAYWYSESDVSTAMHDGFTDTILSRFSYRPDIQIQLASYKTNLKEDEVFEADITIDSSIGRHTAFFIFWDLDRNTPVDVVVEAPDGTTFDKSSDEYNVEYETNIIAVTIPGIAQEGLWKYTIENVDSRTQTVEVKIESKSASESTDPLRLSSMASSDIIMDSPPSVVIYADLSQGYTQVTKATVTALIELPDYSVHEQPLLDNGMGADITKDDGIYSAYFVNFVDVNCRTACRYGVQVTANDEYGTALMATVTTGQSGAMPTDPSAIPTKVDPVPLGDFLRSSSGGSFQVDENVEIPPEGTDLIPPSRIVDLGSPASDYNQQSITLRWTAVGDDLDQGTANHYDLRYSLSFDDVLDNFDKLNAIIITEKNLVRGNLTAPLSAGSIETFIVSLPTKGTGMAYFFAVRAVDEAGNEGAISNIAQNTIVPMISQGLAGWEIFLICMGVILACAIIVGAAVYVAYYSQKKNKKAKVEPSPTNDVEKNKPNEKPKQKKSTKTKTRR